MQKIILTITAWLSVCVAFCQTDSTKKIFNFDFEKITKGSNKLPENWGQWGDGCNLKIDTTEKHRGKTSLLIEALENKSEDSFGCCVSQISANFQGKEIELKGYMKMHNVDNGVVGLLLRIDGENGILQFDNMRQKNIHGTKDWALYTIKLPFPENAKTIYIGGLLTGSGSLWIDDFQVLIDGKDIKDAKLKQQIEYKADKDRGFDNGSNILSFNLTESKSDDLALLGKVWGYLKYYHPSIAKGEYNWDYELFRVLPKILDTKNQIERNNILYDWVKSFGKIDVEKQKKNKEEAIKMNPDLAWINNSILGDDLTLQLTNIKNTKRIDDNYYIGLVAGVGNPEFKNEKPYTTMKYPDTGYRLLSLYRYWNIIQYYFPYKNLIEENWNDVLKEFIPKFLNASNELEYKQTVLALIARIHDTHGNIWGQDNTLKNYRGLNYAPVEVTFIENKAVVTDYYDLVLGKKSGLKNGDVIETINNKPVEEIIKEKLPFTPASNYPTQLRDIAKDLLRTNDTLLTIGYIQNNRKFSKQIECFNSNKINLYKKYETKDTCFKLINSNISYLYPGSVKNEYFTKIIPEAIKTKGLIIDFRCYPSDFIVFSLSEYLLPEKTNFVKFSNGSITSPGLFTMTDDLQVGKKNKNFYKGKVVIIVNETTQSQAEYTTMAFRTAPRATVIGSTTAGADGNVSQFFLPGGINTMISGIGIYYPDGRETQRIGIVPDIEIKPTIKGILENRDELLEKAIEIINKK